MPGDVPECKTASGLDLGRSAGEAGQYYNREGRPPMVTDCGADLARAAVANRRGHGSWTARSRAVSKPPPIAPESRPPALPGDLPATRGPVTGSTAEATPAQPASASEPARSRRVRQLPPPPRAEQLPPPLPRPVGGASLENVPPPSRWAKPRRREAVSFLASFVIHFLALVGLALWVQPAGSGNPLGWLDGALDETIEVERLESDPLVPTTMAAASGDVAEALAEVVPVEPEPLSPSLAELSPAEPSAAEMPQPEGSSPVAASDEPSDWMLQDSLAAVGAEELDGRGAEARARWVAARGGNAESEAAVERGLRWLAAHQRADGSCGSKAGSTTVPLPPPAR